MIPKKETGRNRKKQEEIVRTGRKGRNSKKKVIKKTERNRKKQ